MKIGGKVPGIRRGVYVLKRGETEFPLHLRALPFGAWDRLRKRLGGEPEPPQGNGFVRSKDGYLRDENNQPIRKVNASDPAYLEAQAKWIPRLNAAAFLEAADLKASKITFTSKLDGDGDFVAYCDSILKEIEAAGISEFELGQIAVKVVELGGLDVKELEAARDGFLPE